MLMFFSLAHRVRSSFRAAAALVLSLLATVPDVARAQQPQPPPGSLPAAPLLLPPGGVAPVRPPQLTPGPVSMGTTPRPAALIELCRPQIDVVRDGVPGNLGVENGQRRRPLLVPLGPGEVTPVNLRFDASLRGRAIQLRCFRGLEVAVLGAGAPSFGVWHDAVIGPAGQVLVLARLSEDDRHGELQVVVDGVMTVVPILALERERLQRILSNLPSNWLRRPQ